LHARGKSVRRLEEFVGLAQFGVLPPQPVQLFDLLGNALVGALSVVGSGLAVRVRRASWGTPSH
jgi:hypothetical protein